MKDTMVDIGKALSLNPTNNFFQQYRVSLDGFIKKVYMDRLVFVVNVLEQVEKEMEVKEKMEIMSKVNSKIQQTLNIWEQHSETVAFPDECKVLNIMKEKYVVAINFFFEIGNYDQLYLAIDGNQRFKIFYESLNKLSSFETANIEEAVLQSLTDCQL